MVVVPCLYWSTTRKERAITQVKEKTTMTVQQELTSTNHHKDDEAVSFELMKDEVKKAFIRNGAEVMHKQLCCFMNVSCNQYLPKLTLK